MGVAGGEGCRDERRGSSASEVGTVDGTAKKKKKKKHPPLLVDFVRQVTFLVALAALGYYTLCLLACQVRAIVGSSSLYGSVSV